MTDEQVIAHAVELLRDDEDYIADARAFAPRGNSIVGSVINLTLQVPRQHAEAAVCRAIAILDSEK